ncbi:MAG TPA: hypothetical protein VFY23_16800 [Candidatus Limnocylindrales bacterium]|nr:hypothetical protein [Candidatus Limnocylindrales bacterium]
MIVEPVPTNPRSPVRRGLRVAGMTIPLVLLVGVVAAGVLGPKPPPDDAASPAPSAVAEAEGAARVPDERPPALVLDGRAIDFPETWVGFAVRSVADTLAARAATGAEGVIAVSGYLSYGSMPWTCVDAYLEADRPPCEGRTLLADVDVHPDADGGGWGQIGPHLHPVFLPGARGPAPAGEGAAADDPRAEPIPVVVLGRFTDPPDTVCEPGTRDCGRGFVVERVVWVAGVPWAPVLTVDPAMDVDPNIPEISATVRAAADALGRGSLPLATSVLRPDLLETLAPEAAAALPAIPEGERLRPVTYARGLVFEFDASQPLYGRDPVIGWVVLDSISGELLARGGPKSEPLTDEAAARPGG